MSTSEQLGLLAVLGLVVAWLLFRPARKATAYAADVPTGTGAPTQPLVPPAAPPPISISAPSTWLVAPSTGPAAETRRGAGHF